MRGLNLRTLLTISLFTSSAIILNPSSQLNGTSNFNDSTLLKNSTHFRNFNTPLNFANIPNYRNISNLKNSQRPVVLVEDDEVKEDKYWIAIVGIMSAFFLGIVSVCDDFFFDDFFNSSLPTNDDDDSAGQINIEKANSTATFNWIAKLYSSSIVYSKYAIQYQWTILIHHLSTFIENAILSSFRLVARRVLGKVAALFGLNWLVGSLGLIKRRRAGKNLVSNVNPPSSLTHLPLCSYTLKWKIIAEDQVVWEALSQCRPLSRFFYSSEFFYLPLLKSPSNLIFNVFSLTQGISNILIKGIPSDTFLLGFIASPVVITTNSVRWDSNGKKCIWTPFVDSIGTSAVGLDPDSSSSSSSTETESKESNDEKRNEEISLDPFVPNATTITTTSPQLEKPAIVEFELNEVLSLDEGCESLSPSSSSSSSSSTPSLVKVKGSTSNLKRSKSKKKNKKKSNQCDTGRKSNCPCRECTPPRESKQGRRKL